MNREEELSRLEKISIEGSRTWVFGSSKVSVPIEDFNWLISYADKLEQALAIAKEALEQNANEDYRGNRSSASIRSFHALEQIEKITCGKT